MSGKSAKLELIEFIENSKNPEKAMRIAVDIFRRMVAGESLDSIGASYGVAPEQIRAWEAQTNG